MKSSLTTRSSLVFATVALTTIFGALPSFAETTTPPSAVTHTGPKDIEARITHLHDQLKITPEEETLWSPVAQVMRDNSAAMGAAIKERNEKGPNMTAPDDIMSFQAITAAHADGLQKLAAAFSPLYTSMSEAQQKNADKVFGHEKAAVKKEKAQ